MVSEWRAATSTVNSAAPGGGMECSWVYRARLSRNALGWYHLVTPSCSPGKLANRSAARANMLKIVWSRIQARMAFTVAVLLFFFYIYILVLFKH